jgi:hypothetical protein
VEKGQVVVKPADKQNPLFALSKQDFLINYCAADKSPLTEDAFRN